jgi:hypothetical protein
MAKVRVALDDSRLKYGPYTQANVDGTTDGGIAIADCGLIYGYAYQPERFVGDGPVKTTSPFEPDTANYMPLFDDVDSAVAFLKDRGFYGHVLRYAHDRLSATPGATRTTVLGRDDSYTAPARPWITAGVVAVVNIPEPEDGKPLSAHVSIMSLTSNEPPTYHVKD